MVKEQRKKVFANEECDYDIGYELAKSYYFDKIITVLSLADSLLKRNLFVEIIEDHLANSRKEKTSLLAA
ncbi:hypothetical protein L345_02458, partial [Ophiophagus hannah]